MGTRKRKALEFPHCLSRLFWLFFFPVNMDSATSLLGKKNFCTLSVLLCSVFVYIFIVKIVTVIPIKSKAYAENAVLILSYRTFHFVTR